MRSSEQKAMNSHFHDSVFILTSGCQLQLNCRETSVGGRTNHKREELRDATNQEVPNTKRVKNQSGTRITNPCNVSPVAGSVITGHLSVRHSRLFVHAGRSGGRVWYLYIYPRWPPTCYWNRNSQHTHKLLPLSSTPNSLTCTLAGEIWQTRFMCTQLNLLWENQFWCLIECTS